MAQSNEKQSTRQLLAEYAMLLNKYGPDSSEANIYLNTHKDNQEFVELAELSQLLKKALCSPNEYIISPSQ